jgi:CheY-like chemotaxis protein
MTDPQILVVDDLDDWRHMISGLLSDLGYHCTSAASAEEAIQILKTHRIRLAILDLRLSEVDQYDQGGLDIFRWVTSHCEDTKVIIMSAYPTLDTVKIALRGPKRCEAYIEKDKIFEELISRQGRN